ncbi:hypothetical protein HanRHA438_Chr02g0053381 [Helianthus annuus]|nr:hypothetical protein HanRHA438_Chr02g0053381 [Helianthus annuus]
MHKKLKSIIICKIFRDLSFSRTFLTFFKDLKILGRRIKAVWFTNLNRIWIAPSTR